MTAAAAYHNAKALTMHLSLCICVYHVCMYVHVCVCARVWVCVCVSVCLYCVLLVQYQSDAVAVRPMSFPWDSVRTCTCS